MSGCLGADLNLACDVKRGSMFALTTLKALKSVTCPQIDTCKRDPCIYSHEPPKPRAGSSNDASASDTVHQTTTSQGNTASVKRPLPPLDDFSRLNKCKVQKPNPSPSSSSISSAKATSSSDPLKSLKLEQFSVMTSHTNEEARMKIARLYFEVLQKLYESLPEPPETRTALAIKHASAQEGLGPPTVPGLDHLADHFDHQGIVYKASNKFTYKNMAAQSLTRFKKLSKPSHISQTGTLQDLDKRKTSAAHSKSLQISRHQLQHLTLNNFDMDLWGQDFVFNEPETDPFSLRTEEGTTKDCSRCKKGFFVKPHLEPHEERECSHHWGRPFMEMVGGAKQRLWSCCRSAANSTGTACAMGAHVFTESDPVSLHARQRFRYTKDISTAEVPLDIAAVDCELVYTTAGLSLARVTVVTPDRQVALDEHVRPDPAALLDTNFRFSGIEKEQLKNAKYDLIGVQQALGKIIGPETVLLGHGIENDLRALRLLHPMGSIVDTSILFPHPGGAPKRLGLRALTKQHLGQFIQDTGSHDSKDDAIATLDLVRFKISKMQ